MADHTPSSGSHIKPYRSHHGSMMVRGYPESTASTFATGDLVELNSGAATNAHRVQLASSNSTGYLGVAASDASSNQDDMVSVFEARPGNEFIGWVNATILSSMVGEYRHFQRDTTLGIDILSAATTNARVRITEVNLQSVAGGPYEIGDTNGYVAFEFVADHTVFGPKTPPAQS